MRERLSKIWLGILSTIPWVWKHGISSMLHGLVAVVAVVASYFLFLWVQVGDLPPAFGAGVGYGAIMYLYTAREAGDISDSYRDKDWPRFMDSFLDWFWPLVLGLVAAMVLL